MTPPDSHENTHLSGTTGFGLSDNDYKQDDILGGRYRIVSLLGRGGMGVVYKVEQIFLGKELALKTIDRHLMSDITVRRFQAEARAAFAVDHPSIVAVHDFGLFDDGTPFLVMEIVQGETLTDRLKRGTLSVDEAISIYIQVCFGLAHAHENGVVHRDIKPGNIMLLTDVPDGIDAGVKILDFGIAKLAQSENGEIQALTRTGEIFGSPLYMSPEQCSGGKIDHRADVYSLGCVIFESLTGSPPYVGENALLTMMMHQTAEIPTLKEGSLGADFPAGIERLVACMLAKNPNERYQNLGIAAHDLAALRRGEAPRLSSVITPKRPVAENSESGVIELNRNNFIFSMLAMSLATMLISGGITYFTVSEKNHTSEIADGAPTKNTKPATQNDQTKTGVSEETSIFAQKIAQREVEFVTKFASDLSLKELDQYPFAQVLDVEDGRITDDGIAYLQNSKLLELNLRNSTIKSLNSLDKLPYIQNLDLTHTKIDDTAMPKIAGLKMLHNLALVDCDISESGLRELISSPSLRKLELSPDKYTADFINELYEKMPQCIILPYRSTFKLQDFESAERKKLDEPTTLQRMIAVTQKSNKNLAIIGVYLTKLAAIRYQQNRFKESSQYADQAVVQLEQCGDLTALVDALEEQATNAVEQKNAKKALALNDRAEKLFVDTAVHSKDETLLDKLHSFTYIPITLKIFHPAIGYCSTALDLIKRFPKLDNDKKYSKLFTEKIGYFYSMEGKDDLALPYLKQLVDLSRLTKDKEPQLYLRAIIEYSNILNLDYVKRKELYKEAIEGLEKLGFPEDYNLNEHYYNACQHVSEIYAAERNYDDAILYARKGLAAVGHFKQPDVNNRRGYFIESIIKNLRAAGHEAEAKKEMARYGVKI